MAGPLCISYRAIWRQVQGRDRTAHCPPHTASNGTWRILQDDNATPHRARVVTGFFQQHQVTQMDWPAHSPDLAPVENLWDVLGRRVHDNHPPAANLAQLFKFFQQE